ncbi:MAG: RluA family pseudouridine synthase [Synergistaceae bacterium]|jgi:23S rRNA pseudouridine955/2504/2580 synthase|nr:RluA family pseudouridine synthase [Synergistaceae bacterium]
MIEARGFTVTPDQDGRRLDRVLRGLYRGVSLGYIMAAIRRGNVRVNGAKSGGDARLAAGDAVTVPWPAPQALDRRIGKRSAGELQTLFKSEDVWILEKPAGLLSQPDWKSDDSVITRVWSRLSWTRTDFRPALVHRLDRGASGAIAAALSGPALRMLSELVREGMIKKIYLAVVSGIPPKAGEIDLPLLKSENGNMVVVDDRGKRSITRYRTIGSDGTNALVEMDLVTGRPHQARVHMASIGHPIIGDAKYGGLPAERLFLHACSLTFPDVAGLPRNLRNNTITSKTPREFALLSKLPEQG